MCSCQENLGDFIREVIIHIKVVSAHLRSLVVACGQQGEKNRRLPYLCYPAPALLAVVQAWSDPLLHLEIEHSEKPLARLGPERSFAKRYNLFQCA